MTAIAAMMARRVPSPVVALLVHAPLYLRYLTASGCALGCDLAIFLALLHGGTAPALAAAAGFLSGDVVHWLISSRTIFAGRLLARDAGRLRQRALFFASSLTGLAVTTGVVGGGAAFGLDPRLAKLAAIAVSFNVVFLMRRYVIFGDRTVAAARTPAATERLWPAVLGGWLLAASILLLAMAADPRPPLSTDPDDPMRLLEVRDWLAGQSWWDVSQHRLWHGAFAMHWSRLVDLPLAAAIVTVRPMLGPAAAERAAMILVPLLTLLCVIALVAGITRRLAGSEAAKLAILLTPLSAPLLQQVRPLRIDHHGWQVAAVLAAVGALLAEPARRSGTLAGLALAALLTISLEGLPISVAVVGVAVLAWVVRPDRSPQVAGLLLAFAPGSLALHIATRGPQAFAVACDAMSPPLLLGLGIGSAILGVGLAARPTTPVGRLLPCVIAAGAAGATLFGLAPQCTAGPFSMLDPLVRDVWYRNVAEGLPIWRQTPVIAAAAVPGPMIGLIGAALAIRGSADQARDRWLMFGAIALAAFVAELFVVRAGATAGALALPGAAVLLVRLLGTTRTIRRVPARILATTSSLLVAAPGLAAAAVTTASLGAAASRDTALAAAAMRSGPAPCLAPGRYADVRRLPAATLLAPLNITPAVLVISTHRAVASSYHRNTAAIHAVIATFTAAPDAARAIVGTTGAAYLVACPDDDELAVYAARNPDGLWARLARGERFDWLRPVPLAGSPLLVWRVVPSHRRLPTAAPRP